MSDVGWWRRHEALDWRQLREDVRLPGRVQAGQPTCMPEEDPLATVHIRMRFYVLAEIEESLAGVNLRKSWRLGCAVQARWSH